MDGKHNDDDGSFLLTFHFAFWSYDFLTGRSSHSSSYRNFVLIGNIPIPPGVAWFPQVVKPWVCQQEFCCIVIRKSEAGLRINTEEYKGCVRAEPGGPRWPENEPKCAHKNQPTSKLRQIQATDCIFNESVTQLFNESSSLEAVWRNHKSVGNTTSA